ncbi:MAG: transposase [Candidatus Omnitrophica bacterium]|nr:transposase [Candidatus Omnitrophota bacterium]
MTSRVIRKEFPKLEEWLWGDSFWADGYFAVSVGRIDETSIKKYIREQWRGHGQITLLPRPPGL